MKRFQFIPFIFLLFILFPSYSHCQSTLSSPKIVIDGNPIPSDLPIRIVNDRAMVPLRKIAPYFASDIQWIPEEQQIILSSKEYQKPITLIVGKAYGKIGEATTLLDVAPILENGHSFVPLRFIAEAYQRKVVWVFETRTVYIGDAPATVIENWD